MQYHRVLKLSCVIGLLVWICLLSIHPIYLLAIIATDSSIFQPKAPPVSVDTSHRPCHHRWSYKQYTTVRQHTDIAASFYEWLDYLTHRRTQPYNRTVGSDYHCPKWHVNDDISNEVTDASIREDRGGCRVILTNILTRPQVGIGSSFSGLALVSIPMSSWPWLVSTSHLSSTAVSKGKLQRHISICQPSPSPKVHRHPDIIFSALTFYISYEEDMGLHSAEA